MGGGIAESIGGLQRHGAEVDSQAGFFEGEFRTGAVGSGSASVQGAVEAIGWRPGRKPGQRGIGDPGRREAPGARGAVCLTTSIALIEYRASQFRVTVDKRREKREGQQQNERNCGQSPIGDRSECALRGSGFGTMPTRQWSRWAWSTSRARCGESVEISRTKPSCSAFAQLGVPSTTSWPSTMKPRRLHCSASSR